jgi:hypothetical protein
MRKGLWQDTIERDENLSDPQHAIINVDRGDNLLSALEIMARYRVIADTALTTIANLPVAASLKKPFLAATGKRWSDQS